MNPSAPRDIAALIDHTLLKPHATRREIETLCAEAAEFGFAAVCLNPTWVRLGASLLADARVAVCTVVGFPLGATTTDVKQYETRRAIENGAREIDMVINIGALKSGELDLVRQDIEAVVSTCFESGVLSKVILETALLDEDEKRTVCALAVHAGADYVKTSTGFAASGATVSDVKLMRRAVSEAQRAAPPRLRPDVGIKASGGIRDLATLRVMVEAGATRIGASAGVAIVREAEEAVR
jgi:deoxyribose-phosphate aldolase